MSRSTNKKNQVKEEKLRLSANVSRFLGEQALGGRQVLCEPTPRKKELDSAESKQAQPKAKRAMEGEGSNCCRKEGEKVIKRDFW